MSSPSSAGRGPQLQGLRPTHQTLLALSAHLCVSVPVLVSGQEVVCLFVLKWAVLCTRVCSELWSAVHHQFVLNCGQCCAPPVCSELWSAVHHQFVLNCGQCCAPPVCSELWSAVHHQFVLKWAVLRTTRKRESVSLCGHCVQEVSFKSCVPGTVTCIRPSGRGTVSDWNHMNTTASKLCSLE